MIHGLQLQWSVGNVPSGQDTLERMGVAFERAGDNIVDFGKYIFPKLVPVFEAEVKGQLDAQGRGPKTGSFAALSERYERWKEANYPGKLILERTGTLREALTSSSSPFALRQISGTEFDFGTTNVPYASFHQSGTFRMPDRPPYDFTEDLEVGITRAAAAGVREAIKDAKADEFVTVVS